MMSRPVAHIARILAVWCSLIVLPIAVWAVPPMHGVGGKEPQLPTLRMRGKGNSHLSSPRNSARRSTTEESVQRGLVLLVDFPDVALDSQNTVLAFDSMVNADDYSYDGAHGSIRQYFSDQSLGQLQPQFDVVGPIHLPRPMAHYGGQQSEDRADNYLGDFVIDACRLADDSFGVDFSQYDLNGDSVVDFLYILYAGYSQAEGGSADCIWPHSWDLMSAIYFGYSMDTSYYVLVDTITGEVLDYRIPMFDSTYVLAYACSNERHRYYDHARCGIGVFCHEFSHVLGLMDYYNTDDQSRADSTPGSWSLMSNGCYNDRGKCPPNYSAFDKYILGWVEPTWLADTIHLELPADGATYGMFSRVTDVLADTAFFLENRQLTGWDEHLPAHGMLIWRVVYVDSLWEQDRVNTDQTHYLLMTADEEAPNSSVRDSLMNKGNIPFPGDMERHEIGLSGGCQLLHIEETDGMISLDVQAPQRPVEEPSNEPRKYLRNGIIMIERNDGCWTILGERVTSSPL